EAAPRILPALPERIADETLGILRKLGVEVHTDARVSEVTQAGVRLADGTFLDAELVVWAAGVKAPDMLRDIGGLETNHANQLVVRQTLQTTRDDTIFAMGDCAACPWPGHEGSVPPRAQAAHQQASHLARQLSRRLHGDPVRPYAYRDFGSLVSLGRYTTVGNLMSLTGRNFFIEGLFASFAYRSLYKMHEVALHGWRRVAVESFGRILARRTEPVVKLH
ncbi:MAG TPA: FAD-dependent oxidoreductase, partial [Acetobacteraceae bacterium]|nr:FAD-dependent oxidoreductase [Acetobacteraceae bacterium]